jgi:Multiubiquitin
MHNPEHDHDNEHGPGGGQGPPDKKSYHIKIDRTEYEVEQSSLTGTQLRSVAVPPIGMDRDLFEVVPGGSDRKIANEESVPMRDGLRFFTAPAQINPG